MNITARITYLLIRFRMAVFSVMLENIRSSDISSFNNLRSIVKA